MILLVDNYDSFTYNLYQAFGGLGARIDVRRNDAIDIPGILRRHDMIVLSPGPGRPTEAGATPQIIRELSGALPILGVCLGHQAIGEVFGGRIVPARRLMHGKASLIRHNRRGVFTGLSNPMVATRYHSLVVERSSCPACLVITAETEDGTIMALRHREHPTVGVQFHPESIMTPDGERLLRNFLEGRL
ncbi:MAG: aminodeoxychorismate/anthranilate synthase component II [Candidatus Zixiibacteriota bacterium]